jgi:hypothetical protein
MSSKPTFALTRTSGDAVVNANAQLRGGYPYGDTQENDDGQTMSREDLWLYKAKKYHFKCQKKLREMMANGQKCPAGFEKYLGRFEA